MRLVRTLATVGLVVGIVYATIPSYWLLVHPHIAWWRARKARLASVGPLWMLLWVVVAAVTWPWRLMALYATPWTWPGAVTLILAGVWIYSRARHRFSTDQ